LPDDHEPTTQELRAVQARRQRDEAQAAEGAPTESMERAHLRRSEKAEYLEARLAEQQRADEEAAE
jgi:hypothetical protein